MVNLFEYIIEALSLDQVRDYINIKRDPKAQIYMDAFWKTLTEYVLDNGGKQSNNKYRLYIPYTGPNPEVAADDSESSGSHSFWTEMRHYIKYLAETNLEERGYEIEKWNYIEGTCDVSMTDRNGNKKIRPGQKIGKLISGEIDPRTNKSVLDFYNNDPIRLGKNITDAIKGKNLWLVISNHAYDIAGMSTNRDWTSCMNIINGENKEYVAADIEFGTMIAYIIDKNDTNIQHPFGRILIKPYKLSRKGYLGKDAAPVVYAPEVTVYSPYIGLKPIREWLKDICEEIQEGEGMLKNFKQLYSDSFHDKVDRQFKGKKIIDMKDLKEYLNESLTGAHQIHLYIHMVLEKAIGKEWNQKTIDDIVNNSIPVMQFDPAKNPSIARLSKLDTTQPMLIFPDCRTTVREVESFKMDDNIQNLLAETGLDFECVKYYVLLGKPLNKIQRNTENLSDSKKKEIREIIDKIIEDVPLKYKMSWIYNNIDEFNKMIKKYDLKLGSVQKRGRHTNDFIRNLIYKGKIVGQFDMMCIDSIFGPIIFNC